MRGDRRGAPTRDSSSPGPGPSARLPRGLRRLLTAAAATSLGEWGLFVAISVYAYREGGPALLGLAGVVQAVPAVVAAPAATMLIGDRVSRRQVLLVSNALRGVLLVGLCAAVAAGAPVWLAIALTVLHSVASTVNQPARAALIPALARLPQEVSTTNALLSTVNNVGFLGGAGAGGVLLAETDPQTVLGLCSLAYFTGTALIASIPADERAARRGATGRLRAGAQAASALHTILGRAELRVIFVFIAVLSIADGAVGVLVVVAPLRLLEMGTSGIGYLNAACGVGGLATGAVALWLLRRSGLSTGLLTGSLVLGLPLVLVSVVANAAVALLAWACVGLGYSLVKSTSLTLIQRLTPDRSLLGVLGVLESVFVGFLGLGAMLAPLLIDAIGLRWTLATTGLLLPAVAAARWGTLRRFEAQAPVPGPSFELLRSNAIFAPLPLATIESLSRRLAKLEVPAGVSIVEQGAQGDRWYLIAAGEVAISRDGAAVRRLGPGDGFGEIALLRDVPRTATARAVTPCRVLALEREEFLEAVTALPDSYDVATSLADRYLAMRAPSGTA